MLQGYSQDSTEWLYVGTAKDGSATYIKSTYSNKNQVYSNNSFHNVYDVWTKSNIKKGTWNGKTYRDVEEKALYSFDCNASQLERLQQIIYDRNGNMIYSYAPASYETRWNSAAPESMGELMLNKACQLFNK